jgi:hypothetical protein
MLEWDSVIRMRIRTLIEQRFMKQIGENFQSRFSDSYSIDVLDLLNQCLTSCLFHRILGIFQCLLLFGAQVLRFVALQRKPGIRRLIP